MTTITLSNITQATEDPSLKSLNDKPGIQNWFYSKTYHFADEKKEIEFNFFNDDRIHNCQIDENDNIKDFTTAKTCITDFLNSGKDTIFSNPNNGNNVVYVHINGYNENKNRCFFKLTNQLPDPDENNQVIIEGEIVDYRYGVPRSDLSGVVGDTSDEILDDSFILSTIGNLNIGFNNTSNQYDITFS